MRGIALAALMKGAKTSDEKPDPAERDPADDAEDDADDEAEDGLLEGDQDLLAERALARCRR